MEKITDSIHLAKEHTKTDAEFYKVTFFLLICPQISSTLCINVSPLQIQKQAEANRLLLTPEFLELKKIEAISTNNKV